MKLKNKLATSAAAAISIAGLLAPAASAQTAISLKSTGTEISSPTTGDVEWKPTNCEYLWSNAHQVGFQCYNYMSAIQGWVLCSDGEYVYSPTYGDSGWVRFEGNCGNASPSAFGANID